MTLWKAEEENTEALISASPTPPPELHPSHPLTNHNYTPEHVNHVFKDETLCFAFFSLQMPNGLLSGFDALPEKKYVRGSGKLKSTGNFLLLMRIKSYIFH